MEPILIIALNAFKESIRRKILHVFLILAVFIIVGSSFLSAFELGVQIKFLKDLSLSIISLFGVLITIAVAVKQLPAEIEARTIYPLLAKPVTRYELILGKFIGSLYVIFLNLFLISLIFLGLLYSRTKAVDWNIVKSIYLIGIELVSICALCIFFSTFFSLSANATISFLVYILGHVKVGYFEYLISKTQNIFAQFLFTLFYYIIPNLEYFNVKEAIIFDITIPNMYLLKVSLYGIILSCIFLTGAYIIFRRKNL